MKMFVDDLDEAKRVLDILRIIATSDIADT